MTHFTTIEQSKKLIEAGLNPETADMWYGEVYEGVIVGEEETYFLCPTHQMAMKYLREVHKLFITIDWTGYENEFSWSVQDMNSSMSWESDESYILYEHACEAAILFCLENLI